MSRLEFSRALSDRATVSCSRPVRGSCLSRRERRRPRGASARVRARAERRRPQRRSRCGCDWNGEKTLTANEDALW